jgi:hypothetical protein
VATQEQVEELKRTRGRKLMRIPGVSAVGIERGKGEDAYSLVVHLADDDENTRAAVKKAVAGEPVQIVRSGTFRKR